MKKYMMMFPLYSPEESSSGSGEVSSPSDESILNDGGEENGDDEDSDTDKDSEGEPSEDADGDTEDGTEDETGEDGEDEDGEGKDGDGKSKSGKGKEDDGDDDTDEEDGGKQRLSSYTDIKKKFPNFFKEFPDIKSAIFRDERYGEMFGSIKDAEVAKEYSDIYIKMADDIVGDGDISKLLDQVGKAKPASLEKIAYSILPYLNEKHPDVYFEAVSPVIKNLARNIVRSTEGKTDKDSINLRNAALHIHQYVFRDLNLDGTLKAESFGKKTEKSEEVRKLEEKLAYRERQDMDNFLGEVDSRYTRSVTKIVGEALEKDGRLTEWAKNKITADLIKEVKRQMDGDKRFTSSVRSLVEQARRNGYSSDFKSRIMNTALDRAKPLIPEIRRKLVSEALGKKYVPKGEDGKKVDVSSSSSPNKTKFKPRSFEPSKSGVKNNNATPKRSSNPDLDILRS